MRRIGIAVRVLLVIVLVGLGLPAIVQAEGADDGLVAEWHFDEGSGSVLADSSGNGNDGVIYGATWVEGKYGNALSFDGVDDTVKNTWNQVFDSEHTISLWFKSPGGGGRYPRLFELSGSSGSSGFSTALAYDPDGSLRAWTECETSGVRSGEIDYSGTLYNYNVWHHAVYTYDGTTGVLYIDGVVKQSATDNPCSNIDDGETFVIGAYYSGGHSFNGVIDEVRVHNRALSAEEVRALYEGVQLSLTKSAAPHSIKQGQTTTVTLTVKNTGTTEITDIEVSDRIPSDLTFVSGEISKTYTSLRPKDSREFQYVLQPSDAGTFNLDPATATYSDEEGNYHTAESKTATITVIPSTDQPTTLKSSADISTASVHLHGEKTDVVLGEEVLLKLSAVNIIGNPLMHVQVIIIPPSGWSVTASGFAKSGAGQYTTTYDIKEGVGRDIEVRIMPNQIGDDFQVQGRIIYYFGDDSDAREDHTLTLPITVRAEAENGQGAEQAAGAPESEEGASTPGFAAVVAIIGLLAAYLRRKRA